MSSSTIKSKIGVADINFATGNSGAEEQFVRATSAGGLLTLDKIDASHVRFRSALSGGPFAVEDLVDGGGDVPINVGALTCDSVTSSGAISGTVISGSNINGTGNLDVDGSATIGTTVTCQAMSSAGFVKNSAAGVLSGGNVINATDIHDGSISNTEFGYLNGVASNIQDQINVLAAGGFVAANQAEMEAVTINTKAGTPANLQYHPGVAKAWGLVDAVDGSPALTVGHNIESSITDNGIGDYTISWTTDFSSANYAVKGSPDNNGSTNWMVLVVHTRNAGTCRINLGGTVSGYYDKIFHIVAYGDQS